MTQRIILHFLEDILKATDAIYRFVLQMDYEAFANDEKTIRAVEREFEIIGEAVKKIPDSFTDKYPDIPWRSVAGMKDRLTHHYWETEADILWKTIQESLPQLKTIIRKMIENESIEKDYQE